MSEPYGAAAILCAVVHLIKSLESVQNFVFKENFRYGEEYNYSNVITICEPAVFSIFTASPSQYLMIFLSANYFFQNEQFCMFFFL